jgi:hypothetical protein
MFSLALLGIMFALPATQPKSSITADVMTIIAENRFYESRQPLAEGRSMAFCNQFWFVNIKTASGDFSDYKKLTFDAKLSNKPILEIVNTYQNKGWKIVSSSLTIASTTCDKQEKEFEVHYYLLTK